MMDAQKYAGPDKAAVLLIAADDPKALLEALGAEEATDGISKCMVMGDAAYAAVRKKIIILGPSQDCVTKVAKATKSIGDSAAKARLAVLEKSDIYLSISLASIVNAYKDQFLPMVQMMTAATDPEGKSLKRMVKMLTEVSAFDLSVTFDDGGLSLRMLVNPVSDSDMQKMMTDSKSTSDPLLAGLPKENFLFSMGSTGTQSEHAAKFASETPIGDLLKMTQMTGLDADSVKALDAELVKLQKSIERYAASVSALPDGDDGMFGVTLVAETADSGKFIESIRKAYESAWKVTSDEEVAEFKKCIAHKADAETVAGNKVDTITVDLVKIGESQDSDPAELKQAEALFGKEIVIRFGAGAIAAPSSPSEAAKSAMSASASRSPHPPIRSPVMPASAPSAVSCPRPGPVRCTSPLTVSSKSSTESPRRRRRTDALRSTHRQHAAGRLQHRPGRRHAIGLRHPHEAHQGRQGRLRQVRRHHAERRLR